MFGTGGLRRCASRAGEQFDISSDLTELARTPVLVVCAGAKSILHLPRTLRWKSWKRSACRWWAHRTDAFPTFYVRDPVPPLPVSARVDAATSPRHFSRRMSRGWEAGAVLARSRAQRK